MAESVGVAGSIDQRGQHGRRGGPCSFAAGGLGVVGVVGLAGGRERASAVCHHDNHGHRRSAVGGALAQWRTSFISIFGPQLQCRLQALASNCAPPPRVEPATGYIIADAPRAACSPSPLVWMLAATCSSPMMLSTMSSVAASPACVPAMAQLPIIPSRPLQRPKLHINTLQPRIFGKAASLRLDTLSAVSPTARNTFSNAYDPAATTHPTIPSALSDSASSDSASSDSASSDSASSDSSSSVLPYKQPHNLSSILANSPITPRKMATARPRFPAEKRVSFRTPLEENITTVKYTLAHSDIASSTSTLSTLSSLDSTCSSSSSSSVQEPQVQQQPKTPALSLKSVPQLSKPTLATVATDSTAKPRSPRTGEKRDSSSSEDEGDACPQTPVAGRRKRSRDWRWTLGTLPGSTASSSSMTDTASDDSS
jgi:hypothetical protein